MSTSTTSPCPKTPSIRNISRRKVPPPTPFKCLLPLLPLSEDATPEHKENHGVLYPLSWVPAYRESPRNAHALHILTYGESGISEVLADISTIYGSRPSCKSAILSAIRERILQWAGHILQTYGTYWWSMLSSPPRNRVSKQSSSQLEDSSRTTAKRLKIEDGKPTAPTMDPEACSALRLRKIQLFLQPSQLREDLDNIVSISSCPQYYQGQLEREMEKIKVRDNVATIHSRILSMAKPHTVIPNLPFASPSKYASIDGAYRGLAKILDYKDNQAFELDPLTHISPFQQEFLGPIVDYRTTVKSIKSSSTAARTMLHRLLCQIDLAPTRIEELVQNIRNQSTIPK